MNPNVPVATALLNALRAKNLGAAPLAQQVRYVSPLAGEEPVVGRESVIKFLGAYLPFITEVTVLHILSEGDEVCMHWRLDGTFAPLSIVYWLRMKDGQIVDILASYDPRPFLDAIGAHGD